MLHRIFAATSAQHHFRYGDRTRLQRRETLNAPFAQTNVVFHSRVDHGGKHKPTGRDQLVFSLSTHLRTRFEASGLFRPKR